MSGDTEPEVALVAVNTVTQGKGSRVTEHRGGGGRTEVERWFRSVRVALGRL